MTDGSPGQTIAAFGLSLITDEDPPGAWEERTLRAPSLLIRHATAQAIEDSWSGVQEIGWEGFIDGAPFLVQRGVDGDHRFVHGTPPDELGVPSPGTRAVHHLGGDMRALQCAPSDPADVSWWRVVLDSVLFTVALLQGYETLHAGAIATPDGVIAIAAATGGGKSTLLAELLGRGLTLMADDVLVLESRGEEPPIAHPAPPLMTIPDARIHALSGIDPAEAIFSLEGESWIAVPVCGEPRPLKALVVLDRRPGPQPSCSRASLTRIESPLSVLLDSLMRFPRSPERERSRFELASVLASNVGLWRLTASLDTAPEALADTLLAGAL